jgi:hypothetical protein
MATIVPGGKNPWNSIIIHLNSIGYNLIGQKGGLTNRRDDTEWHMPIWHIKDRILIYFSILKNSIPFWHRPFWRDPGDSLG